MSGFPRFISYYGIEFDNEDEDINRVVDKKVKLPAGYRLESLPVSNGDSNDSDMRWVLYLMRITYEHSGSNADLKGDLFGNPTAEELVILSNWCKNNNITWDEPVRRELVFIE